MLLATLADPLITSPNVRLRRRTFLVALTTEYHGFASQDVCDLHHHNRDWWQPESRRLKPIPRFVLRFMKRRNLDSCRNYW